MRKLLFFVGLIIVSCSSDDNSPSNADGELIRNNENLTGNWIIKGGTINGGEFQTYENDCATLEDYQQFLANGDLNFIGHDDSCEVAEFETSKWSISGNNLIIDNPAPINDYSYEIESLTSEKMILVMTNNSPEGVFTQKSHFERQ